MNILKLPNMIYPMMHVDKTNEIVDVLNEELNLSYAEVNPALTSTAGVCNWVVTHNLGTQNVSCRVYKDDKEIITDTEATSDNVVTVKINSTSDIEAETYSVIVLANGGGARGGITAVDSNLSPTSMNPVQNRILYPSLSGFIPDETVFTVKTSGGNFTSLRDAINYLTGKWTNGSVIVSIDAGTFVDSNELTIDCSRFNIPTLRIVGKSVSETILQSNSTTDTETIIRIRYGKVLFENITFTKPTGTKTTDYRGILADAGSFVTVGNVKIFGCNWSLGATRSGFLNTYGNINIENAQNAVVSAPGFVSTTWGTNFIGKNVDTYFYVASGGIIQLFGISNSFTNVTNKTNQEIGTPTAAGWIAGSIPS